MEVIRGLLQQLEGRLKEAHRLYDVWAQNVETATRTRDMYGAEMVECQEAIRILKTILPAETAEGGEL